MRIHSTSSINTLSLLSSSFTLCQHFLSLPMLPFPHPSNLISLPISFLLPPSILPSIIPHSLSLSLLPLFSPLLSVSVNSWKKRREMTRESRLTDSCCQNTSIKHTHTSAHALVIADMYTHTLTHTHSHLMVRLGISRFSVQPDPETHHYLFFYCGVRWLLSQDMFLNSWMANYSDIMQ